MQTPHGTHLSPIVSRISRFLVPVVGEIPEELQTIWLWRGGSCWGGYDMAVTEGARSDNRNLCIAPAYFSPGQWRFFARYLEKHGERLLPVELLYNADNMIKVRATPARHARSPRLPIRKVKPTTARIRHHVLLP